MFPAFKYCQVSLVGPCSNDETLNANFLKGVVSRLSVNHAETDENKRGQGPDYSTDVLGCGLGPTVD